jgi:hypothetical protein
VAGTTNHGVVLVLLADYPPAETLLLEQYISGQSCAGRPPGASC